jgi:hypothetical protein
MDKPSKDYLFDNTDEVKQLTIKDCTNWVTEAEYQELVQKSNNYKPISNLRYIDSYKAWRDHLKRQYKRHRWSDDEIQFLKDNYKYLSDNVIGLALNISAQHIRSKRNTLGLKKERNAEQSHVVVWCKRDDFEKDIAEKGLLKARNYGLS